MPGPEALQIVDILTKIGLLVFGVIVWAERYVRGSEKQTAMQLAEQKTWNSTQQAALDATNLCVRTLTAQLARANDEMSKMTGSWQVKVAQIDEHLRAVDGKVLTLEVILAGARDMIRTNETHIDKIEQEGCVYGRENRKQLDDISRRRRDGDHR